MRGPGANERTAPGTNKISMQSLEPCNLSGFCSVLVQMDLPIQLFVCESESKSLFSQVCPLCHVTLRPTARGSDTNSLIGTAGVTNAAVGHGLAFHLLACVLFSDTNLGLLIAMGGTYSCESA